MISSLASVLVAKANATPENVVPCKIFVSIPMPRPDVTGRIVTRWTYKIYADDELRFTPLAAFYFCEVARPVGVRALWC
jgi:hypothetical protein